MEQEGITWYDILGVLPGAEARKIKREYEAKSALLRPDMIAGARRTCSKRSRGRRTCWTGPGRCSAIR